MIYVIAGEMRIGRNEDGSPKVKQKVLGQHTNEDIAVEMAHKRFTTENWDSVAVFLNRQKVIKFRYGEM